MCFEKTPYSQESEKSGEVLSITKLFLLVLEIFEEYNLVYSSHFIKIINKATNRLLKLGGGNYVPFTWTFPWY